MPAANVDKSNAEAAKSLSRPKAIAKPQAKKTTRKYTKKDAAYWSNLKRIGHERVKKMEEAAKLERTRAELERMRKLHVGEQLVAEAPGSAVAEPAVAEAHGSAVAEPERSTVAELIDLDQIPPTLRRLATRPTMTETELEDEDEDETASGWTTEPLILRPQRHNTERAEGEYTEIAPQLQRAEEGSAEHGYTAPQLGRIVGTDEDVDEDGRVWRLWRRTHSAYGLPQWSAYRWV